MTNHAVPGDHGIRVSRGKAAPPPRFEVVDETVHHRDQMEGNAVKLIGAIVLASSLDLVGALSEAVDTVQPASPEGQILLISIDLNESLLSLFAVGRLAENRLNRREVERIVEYPVPWSEPVVEAVDNRHKVIQLVFDLEKPGALIPCDESGQQFTALNLTGHLLVERQVTRRTVG